MKKFTFFLFMMFAASYLMAQQTIEDFESIKMNLFAQGTTGTLDVVANPDPTGINTSGFVAKMVRAKDGDPWQGWYATLPTPVNMDANKYVHVKVWKPRISPVAFKFEKDGGNSGDVFSMNPQTLVNQWEELVFDYSTVAAVTGEYVKIVLLPDFESPLTLTEDITLYFDDLYVNNDPAVGSAPVSVIENYEIIPTNLLAGGAEDLSFFELISNPDKSGINISDKVLKFHRDKDGVPWGGFWSSIPVPADVTDNKYVHMKLWKPRVSPVKFKLEGGAAGTLEIASMNEQTVTNGWEDFVFDYTSKTGTYPIIAVLPDFSDPVNLTEDIDLYIDDIIVNNDPNPIVPSVQIFNVDMSEAGLEAGQKVWLSGALGGVHGTWMEPGTNPANEMTDPDGDHIYSITVGVPNGVIAFKFFKGEGWNSGDPVGDRTYTVAGSFNLSYKWGVQGYLNVPQVNEKASIKMYPNPVKDELKLDLNFDASRVVISSLLGETVVDRVLDSKTSTISTVDLRNGVYFVTVTSVDGKTITQKLIKE